MIIGTSKLDITPSIPMKLAGFDFRQGTYEKIGMPIFCRCFVFDGQIALVSLELLFVGDYLDDLIRQRLANDPILAALKVQISATHTHSSMQTANNHSPRLGEFSIHYCDDVANRVIEALRIALSNQESVTVKKAIGLCDIAIHRRVINAKGIVEMAPNHEVAIDDRAHLFQFVRHTGSVKAVLIHNHCHPTISGDNVLSGEYPGVVSDEIEQVFDDSVCLFLQGFCGDIRPNVSRANQFYRAHYEDVVRLGKHLALNYLNAMQNPTDMTEEAISHYGEKSVYLPLNAKLTWLELEEYKHLYHQSDIQFEWAVRQQYLLKEGGNTLDNSNQEVKLTFLNINNVIKLITANAEVVNHYQQYITNNLDQHILCVGYCNGMIGYIPTKEQVTQGGYEPNLSSYYFYLPSTFNQEVEHCLKQAFEQIIYEK